MRAHVRAVDHWNGIQSYEAVFLRRSL
jgi:hypothetical protein